MKLQESFFETDTVQMRRWFPMLHLFRIPRMAFDLRKILIGAVVLLLVDLAYFHEFNPGSGDQGKFIHESVLNDAPVLKTIFHPAIIRPISDIARIYSDFGTAMRESGSIYWYFNFISLFLLTLGIWSLAGVGISHIAGHEFASGDRPSIQSTLRGYSKWIQSFFTIWLLPFAAVVGCWIFAAVWGTIANIPVIGPPIFAVTAFLPLLAAVGMTIISIGFLLGWPLMIPSISIDNSDGFDSLGRAYNYTYSRMWNYFSLMFVMLLLGAFAMFLMNGAVIILSGFFIQSASTWSSLAAPSVLPGVAGSPVDLTSGSTLNTWQSIINYLAAGYGISFFWTGCSVVYFLLRKAEDGTPLDELGTSTAASSLINNENEEGVPLVGLSERARQEEGEIKDN